MKQEFEQALSDNLSVTHPGQIDRLFVFGSLIRGDYDEDSDLDVYAVIPKSVWDEGFDVVEKSPCELCINGDRLTDVHIDFKFGDKKVLDNYTPDGQRLEIDNSVLV